MAIVVNLDVVLARRKMVVGEVTDLREGDMTVWASQMVEVCVR